MTTTIDAFIAAIDARVQAVAGVSIHDLPDQPFADWHEDGITPAQAARLALESEGF